MTSCASLHEKFVPSVVPKCSVSYYCSRAAIPTTFSWDPHASVIAFADLWSFRTMNSD